MQYTASGMHITSMQYAVRCLRYAYHEYAVCSTLSQVCQVIYTKLENRLGSLTMHILDTQCSVKNFEQPIIEIFKMPQQKVLF